ncbi:MAG: asparagine synthetase A [archaeon]
MEKERAYQQITSEVLRHSVEFFHRKGFTQLLPVMLSPVTDPLGPDPGSSVIKTGTVEYLGQTLSLTQSMVLHKQIAVTRGIERLFIVSPNIRLEHPDRGKSGKHLFEFSQIDFEIAHGKMGDVFGLMEGLLCWLMGSIRLSCGDELKLVGRELPHFRAPFKRHTTHELEEKYGKDWEITASLGAKEPFWALCHKREFYDKEDPAEPGHYLNYDLIYPEGFGEALSGAEREYEYSALLRRIGKDRLDKGDYRPYLEMAKAGFVPSAGAGFGVERLVRYIAGAKHVGEVQLFSRVPGVAVVV